jgi:hypothetical protein
MNMKMFDMPQGSQEWWAIRRGIPTASEFDKIITPAKCQVSAQARNYICKLIADLAALYPPENVESWTNHAMRHGIDCEPEARRWYEFDRGVQVAQVGFCITDDGRFGCSPDGLVGEDGLLELKCPQLHTHADYLLDGGLPTEYKCQVHGQLVVTGRKWVDFLSYSPGLDPLLIRVEPDEFTAKLASALEVFWQQYQEALQKLGVTVTPCQP